MTIISEDENTETNPIPVQIMKTDISTLEAYDVVVIGGGVAGLSAGLYAARDGYKTLILEGEYSSSVDYPGGALMLTPDIENYPGFSGVAGEELIGIMHAQAEKFGAEIKTARVTEIVHKKNGTHTVVAGEGEIFDTKTIILAMGATARLLGLPGEVDLYGRGVSTCATCDGFFFKEKNVIVVGGGDTAVEDALFLTRYVEKVHLIVRKDSLKASGPQAREILTHPKVEILWNSQVVSLQPSDDGLLQSVILDTKGELFELETTGMFVAIGRDPATSFLATSHIGLDSEQYIAVNGDSTATNVPGIFAAGDVVDKVYRQAITSAGKGAQAALEARHYLLNNQM